MQEWLIGKVSVRFVTGRLLAEESSWVDFRADDSWDDFCSQKNLGRSSSLPRGGGSFFADSKIFPFLKIKIWGAVFSCHFCVLKREIRVIFRSFLVRGLGLESRWASIGNEICYCRIWARSRSDSWILELKIFSSTSSSWRLINSYIVSRDSTFPSKHLLLIPTTATSLEKTG